jgi:hypothetical protein
MTMPSINFTIDALIMSEWQDCKRRYVLSRDWRVIKWRPKSLFDACLRRAIFRISNGLHVEEAAMDARTEFMGAAANPGLDGDKLFDPYKTAMDYCAMLDTILIALSKLTLLCLHDVKDLELTETVSWRTISHADDSGTLHRWITVDNWGHSDIARELHSWWVMGDVCVNRVPMTLHIVEIGQIRNNRRASPWARGYKHPALPGMQIRFKKVGGQEFGSDWKPFYLADHGHAIGPDAWVAIMEKEGVAQERIHHLNVNCPSDSICVSTTDQIITETTAMETLKGSWSTLPMSRNHCDTYVPCPFQHACYSEQTIDIRSIGLYQSRIASHANRP